MTLGSILNTSAADGRCPESLRALDAPSLPVAFQRTVAASPKSLAFGATASEPAMTWAEYDAEVARAAGALADLGLRREDTLALLFPSGRNFHVIDAAALHLGITCFSLYNTASLDAMRYVLDNSGARHVIADETFRERAAELAELVDAVVLVAEGSHDLLDWHQLLADAQEVDLVEASRRVLPEDIATLIYTAGTTGPPKGVELTHANLTFALRTLIAREELPSGANQLSFLPMAHAMARMNDHYLAMMLGFAVTICEQPSRVLEALEQVRPSFFVSTPRVWEKMRTKISERIDGEADPELSADLARVVREGTERVRIEQEAYRRGETVQHTPAAKDAALRQLLTRCVGLDRIAAAMVGGAPVEPHLIEFFHAIGVPLSEAFGMSELSSVCTGNPPARIRFGTVGPPLDGVSLRLAEDGEILVKGPNVMKGYRGEPEQTAEVIDPDGWLHTGDIGVVDPDGYVRIVDRKKDIIISSAGKNMSPSHIQNELKKASPLIEHAVVIGDRRPYNVALLVLDRERAHHVVQRAGTTEVLSTPELVKHEAVRAALDAAIDAANAGLSRPEQIKRYRVVSDTWQPGGEELTPTLKLRRRAITEKYAAVIDEIYAGS